MGVKVGVVLRALEADGWTLVRQRGSHRQFKKPGAPSVITVSGKPSDSVPEGTLSSIRRASGLRDLR